MSSDRQFQVGAVAPWWLPLSPHPPCAAFVFKACCLMATRWLLQLQASCPYTTMFKARRGEGMALGNSPLMTFLRSPQADFSLKLVGQNSGTWPCLAVREDREDSIWQREWYHHVGLAQSWFIAWCFGRSPQSLNSRALYHLPEQNSSSRFC